VNDSKPIRHLIQNGNEFQVDLLIALRSALERVMTIIESPYCLVNHPGNIDKHYGIAKDSRLLLRQNIKKVYKKYGYDVEIGNIGIKISCANGYIDTWEIVAEINCIRNFDKSKNPKSVYTKLISMKINFYMSQPRYKQTGDINYTLYKKCCK